MPDEFQYDIFLSHSSKDKAVVRPLAERLRADGLKVWFDEWEIRPGDSIPAKIEEGLEHSRVLVLCMSAQAFGSDWAQLESHTFRFRDPLNQERRFIPLRFDDTPAKGSLAQFSSVDLRPAARNQEYVKLLGACRKPKKPEQLVKGSGRNWVIEFATAKLSLILPLEPADTMTIRNGGTLWVDGNATIGSLTIGDNATHGTVLFQAGQISTLAVINDVILGPDPANSMDLSFLGASGVLKVGGSIRGSGGGSVRIRSGRIDNYGATLSDIPVFQLIAAPSRTER